LSTLVDTIKSRLLVNLLLTVFLAAFGAVYEVFSHGVYSYHMIYAFAVPLLLSVIPYTLCLIKRKRLPRPAVRIWDCAVLTIAVGCVFQGVLDIYGTTNSLVMVYPVAGGALAAAAIAVMVVKRGEA